MSITVNGIKFTGSPAEIKAIREFAERKGYKIEE